MGDGDGWVNCDAGHRHWGRHGAAGLLLYHLAPEPHVLLQKRARLSIGGGTWGLLGGARHSHEDAVAGALREAGEESTLDPSVVRVHGLIGEHHGGRSYETVIASVAERPDVRRASFETAAVAWVHVDQVPGRRLFPAFADGWPRLRAALVRPVLVVHAAALDGAGTDLARLRDRLAALGPVPNLPGAVADLSFPEIVLAAEDAVPIEEEGPGVRIVTVRDGAGELARLVAPRAPDEHRVVVTGDPALRRRAEAAGATAADPGWLLGLLS
ncbi:NUDIX domain-containing protein [Actinoallomurus rhizosphaericola]|uniref:NUDIX domain-containing protein n=1 Tax=Actinoallomurus rhizosphaericola TaxID=2952536 RepID=UPI002091075C|nr:NUDIX domain-containing protein [Actinoallomurus rhizosphaericola]MCO5991923.1 NUDIX domain-containing protein [Actinoallomurus rhizosphaericola]